MFIHMDKWYTHPDPEKAPFAVSCGECGLRSVRALRISKSGVVSPKQDNPAKAQETPKKGGQNKGSV